MSLLFIIVLLVVSVCHCNEARAVTHGTSLLAELLLINHLTSHLNTISYEGLECTYGIP